MRQLMPFLPQRRLASQLLLLLITSSVDSTHSHVTSSTHYKLLTGGVSQLLWDAVLNVNSRNSSTDDGILHSSHVSADCLSHLRLLRSMYESGDLLPFQCK